MACTWGSARVAFNIKLINIKINEFMSNDYEKRERLKEVASRHLDLAQEAWSKCESELMVKADSVALNTFAEAITTEIPGHAVISSEEYIVDEFIACVIDMRDSSKHLLNEISRRITDVSMLQRVFYETSALLPVAAEIIYSEDGKVTEYLGDGLLGLFRVHDDGRQQCYSALNAGRDIIGVGRDVVNEAIRERYNLPTIDVGVGLAISKAIIAGFGHSKYRQPKVIGECVYRATKLSGGKNVVIVDERLEAIWPTSKSGKLGFTPRRVRDVNGYIVST